MKAFPYIIAVLVTIVTWFILWYWVDPCTILTLYDAKLQFAFFTAFLTVGSFLLAMKAFILVRLRDDVYRTDQYRDRYMEQYNNKYQGDYYEGLVDLGNLLVYSVAAAFFTSILQVTVGFCSIVTVKLIAIASAAGTLTLVLVDWFFVYMNIRDWFEFIEKDIAKDLGKR